LQQSKEQITTIVDADNKNCLAELTVVQKFNHGVLFPACRQAGRQAGLVLSFAQTKERTRLRLSSAALSSNQYLFIIL
jgi:hypothetical protein